MYESILNFKTITPLLPELLAIWYFGAFWTSVDMRNKPPPKLVDQFLDSMNAWLHNKISNADDVVYRILHSDWARAFGL